MFIKIYLKIKYQINIIISYLSRNLVINNFVVYIIDLLFSSFLLYGLSFPIIQKLQIPIREGAFMNHNFICTRTTNFPFKKEVALYNILHDV